MNTSQNMDFRGDLLSPLQFNALGQHIAKYRPSPSARVSRERFVAFFGIEAYLCSIVWKDILENGATLPLKSKPKPEHFLWALLFLRRYDTEPILASIAGCDEKTFRKWCWFYLDAIANLDRKYVSQHQHFCCCS
jgi:hypothetical protein